MLLWQFFKMRFGFISWMSCRFRNHIGCNVSLAKPLKVLDFVWKFGGFRADHTVNCFVFIVASSVLLRHRCQLTRQHRGELLQTQNLTILIILVPFRVLLLRLFRLVVGGSNTEHLNSEPIQLTMVYVANITIFLCIS